MHEKKHVRKKNYQTRIVCSFIIGLHKFEEQIDRLAIHF